MQIKEVTLKNIKSFSHQTIHFMPGVNMIAGQNGVGKSTVFEAIGLALFNYPKSEFRSMIRHGHEIGEIIVVFETGEGCFRVHKTIGRKMGWDIYDPNGEQVDLHGQSDIEDFLRECFQLPVKTDLANLFQQVLGVHQHGFISPFMETEMPRIAHFNRLLKVEEYRKAYSSMRSVLNEMQHQKELIVQKLVALEEHIEQLPKVEEELKGLRATLVKQQEQLQEMAKEKDALEKQLQEKREEEKLAMQIEREKTLLIEREKTYQSQMQELIEQKERISKEKEQSELQYQALLQKFDAAKQEEQKHKEEKEQLDVLAKLVMQMQHLLENINDQLQTQAQYQETITLFEKEKENYKSYKDAVLQRETMLLKQQQKEQLLVAAIEDKVRAEAGECPILGGECPKAEGDLVVAIEKRIINIETDIQTQAQMLQELFERIEEKKGLEALQKQAEIAHASLESGKEKLEEYQRQMHAYHQSFLKHPLCLEKEEQQDDAFAYSKILIEKTYPAIATCFKEKHQTAQIRFEEIAAEERKISEKIGILENNLDNYEKTSLRLEKEKEAMQQSRETIAALEKKKAPYVEKNTQFDLIETEQKLKETTSSWLETSTLIARVQEQVIAQEKEQMRFLQQQQQYTTTTSKLEENTQMQHTAEMVRTVLRETGVDVGKQLRLAITHEANIIHRQIASSSAQLLWDDSYELSLHDVLDGEKRERTFKMLSGGEKMTVALAVRLAMLKHLSTLGIGFFDEPTSNLDAERKDRLANIIPEAAGGFEQLFFISHDDTFHAIVGNTIRLEHSTNGSFVADNE